MIRKAAAADISAIADTYTALLTHEAQHGSHSNWRLGVYPTAAVPEAAVPAGTMYVLDDGGEICASMVLNHAQPEEYAHVPWSFPGAGAQVLVIHTLCIPPQRAGHGYGRRMVQFAQDFAAANGCTAIRIDTYAHNEPAQKLYLKNGFRIAGWGRMCLQGVIDEEQVYLEWAVPHA